MEKKFPVNSSVFGSVNWSIPIFEEATKVAMTAKFRQEYAKMSHILVMENRWGHFFACRLR